MRSQDFGPTSDGRPTTLWHLGGPGGLEAAFLDRGARLVSLRVPGPHGPVETVLGLPNAAAYEADPAYLGATIGRFAGRIEAACFPLDGQPIRLQANDGTATLHGGPTGFDRAPWQATPDGDALLLRHTSPHGDQGFPGTLAVTLRVAILDGRTLSFDYTATTDRPTVLNLTNHAYFNLAGAGTVHDHVLTLAADRYVPIGPGLTPAGPPRPVADTVFDFRTPTAIGARIAGDDPQLRLAGGYDHSYVLAEAPALEPRWAARVTAGFLAMDVFTTEPSIQLYTANSLAARRHEALCLETQHLPDSPNRPDQPSTVLRPGTVFRSRTLYRFSG